jgi:hypothetical protein
MNQEIIPVGKAGVRARLWALLLAAPEGSATASRFLYDPATDTVQGVKVVGSAEDILKRLYCLGYDDQGVTCALARLGVLA